MTLARTPSSHRVLRLPKSSCRDNPLVVFSGIDGAGKSTQIEVLTGAWQSAGRRPKRVWARGGYTPGMNFLKGIARRVLGRRVVPPAGPSAARTQAFSRARTRRWWLRLAILDLILLYGFAIRWWQLWGRPVICDRYWPDTELDFQINFPQEPFQAWLCWRLLMRIAPRPDHAFLMLVPLQESLRRSQLKNEPFPDAPEVLARRLKTYQQWSLNEHWTTLDGCQDVETLAARIADQVGLPCDAATPGP